MADVHVIFEKISKLCQSFSSVSFEEEQACVNSVTGDISKIVLYDGRFQSFLVMDGHSWLHSKF